MDFQSFCHRINLPFEKLSERKTHTRERESERAHKLPIHRFIPYGPQMAPSWSLRQEPRTQRGLPRGWQGPKYPSHHCRRPGEQTRMEPRPSDTRYWRATWLRLASTLLTDLLHLRVHKLLEAPHPIQDSLYRVDPSGRGFRPRIKVNHLEQDTALLLRGCRPRAAVTLPTTDTLKPLQVHALPRMSQVSSTMDSGASCPFFNCLPPQQPGPALLTDES